MKVFLGPLVLALVVLGCTPSMNFPAPEPAVTPPEAAPNEVTVLGGGPSSKPSVTESPVSTGPVATPSSSSTVLSVASTPTVIPSATPTASGAPVSPSPAPVLGPRPNPSISGVASGTTIYKDASVTLDFGQSVTGFLVSQLLTSNCTVTLQSSLGNGVYQLLLTPVSAGGLSVSMPAGLVVGLDGQTNSASSASFSLTYSTSGTSGADVIQGRPGVDNVIFGGAGADTLYGMGGGQNTFVYTNVSESGVGSGARDVIMDFDVSKDVLDLSGLSQNLRILGQGASFTATGKPALSWIANGSDTSVLIDANGDGISDFEVLLKNVSPAAFTVGNNLRLGKAVGVGTTSKNLRAGQSGGVLYGGYGGGTLTGGSGSTTLYSGFGNMDITYVNNSVYWADATDPSVVTIDGSNNYQTIIDKSSAAVNTTQNSTPSSRARYTKNLLGGRAAMDFTPGGRSMVVNSDTSLDHNGDFTIYAILNFMAHVDYAGIVTKWGATPQYYLVECWLWSWPPVGSLCVANGGASYWASTAGNLAQYGSFAVYSKTTTYGLGTNNNTSNFYRNGVIHTTQYPSGTGKTVNNTAAMTVGGGLNGYISEVALFNRGLISEEQAFLDQFFALKHGLAIAGSPFAVTTLVSGTGATRFSWGPGSRAQVGSGNRDLVSGFNSGKDVLDFTALPGHFVNQGQANLTATGVAQFNWKAGGSGVVIQVDYGGDGVADMEVEVSGISTATLTAGSTLLFN